MMAPGYELLEHTSEVELRVHAPSWSALLVEAADALTAHLTGGTPPHGTRTAWRRVDVRAPDRCALLVDWLNELLYRAEAEWWIPVEVVVETASDCEVRARVRGVPVDTAPTAVKAATLHGVSVGTGAAGLEATVILDV
jgi:SHS2 domain-containing protein